MLPDGYPLRFYSDRRKSWVFLIVFPGVLFSGFALLNLVNIYRGAPVLLQFIGMAIAAAILRSVVKGELQAWREARIYPFYDQILPNAGTYTHGQAILRNLLHLDKLAAEKCVKSISAYGFPDPLSREVVTWHDATTGLETIKSLIQAVTEQPESVNDASAVLADLERIRSAFERAHEKGVRFSFLIEGMHGTSSLVWERRGGFI